MPQDFARNMGTHQDLVRLKVPDTRGLCFKASHSKPDSM